MAADLISKRKRCSTFTIINNEPVNNPNLRYEDIGLLAFVLSNQDNRVINKKMLVSSHLNGMDSVDGILKRLIENGYLKMNKYRNPKGHFDTEYIFSDTPWDFSRSIHFKSAGV